MSLRNEGLRWLEAHYGSLSGPKHVSKFYPPDESWTKKPAWAFEIAAAELDVTHEDLHLLCQREESPNEFHYLRIPSSYLIEHRSGLYFREERGTFSLFLSAEPNLQFSEVRGNGNIRFDIFLQ